MQRHFISAGKALCRYCGEQIATNKLSTHIASKHPRPKRGALTPTLVRSPGAVGAGSAK